MSDGRDPYGRWVPDHPLVGVMVADKIGGRAGKVTAVHEASNGLVTLRIDDDVEMLRSEVRPVPPVELAREDDSRWIADMLGEGCLAYGATEDEAADAVRGKAAGPTLTPEELARGLTTAKAIERLAPLRALQAHNIEKEHLAGAAMFMGLPDRWLADPTWRCLNGHVSKRFLKTETGDRCLACGDLVLLTFPEDAEDGSDGAQG